MTGEAQVGALARPDGRSGGWRVAFLVVSLAAAFADASIVVLGLPDMYADFIGATPFSLALIIVAYNFVVALVAFAVHPYLGKLLDARRVAQIGLLVFLASCMACAAAQSIEVLTVFRFAQGLGAGLIIVSALELIRGMAESERKGSSLWGAAGFLGAAVGPALGGALTELFGWRGIFVGVGILAIPGLVALIGKAPTRTSAEEQHGTDGRWLAATELMLYGTLVCALFLTITMLVDVWLLTPIEAAGVLTTLPAAAVLGWPVARLAPGRLGPVVGFLLLTLGLLELAFVPSISIWIPVTTLALCGFGIGLIVPFLNDLVVSDGNEPEAAAHSVGFRHLGLVLGILIVGPLTWHGLTSAVQPAIAVAVAGTLEAPIPLSDKTSLAVEVANAFQTVNAGETPDIEAIAGALPPESQQTLADSIADRVQPVFTRALRWSFIAGAILALLAIVPFLLITRPTRDPDSATVAAGGAHASRRQPGTVVLAIVLAGSVALLAWEFAAGGASFGEGGREEACSGLQRTTEPVSPREIAQRAIEDAVLATACRIAESPPDLLAALVRGAASDDTLATLQSELEKKIASVEDRIGATLTTKLQTLAESTPAQLVVDGRRIMEKLTSG